MIVTVRVGKETHTYSDADGADVQAAGATVKVLEDGLQVLPYSSRRIAIGVPSLQVNYYALDVLWPEAVDPRVAANKP